MTTFAALWQASMPALDSTFGRKVRVIKMTKGPYTPGPDPSLLPFDVVGVLDERPLVLRQIGASADRADQPDRAAAECSVDFDARVFATPGHIPDEGWRIETYPDQIRPVPQAYEVTWREPFSEGRIVLHIAPVKP